MEPGEFLRLGIETVVLLAPRSNTLAVEKQENIPQNVLNVYEEFADPQWPWMHLDIDGSYAGDATNKWPLTDNVSMVPGEGQSTILSEPTGSPANAGFIIPGHPLRQSQFWLDPKS